MAPHTAAHRANLLSDMPSRVNDGRKDGLGSTAKGTPNTTSPAAPDARVLQEEVGRLRTSVAVLHAHEPDPTNGAAWVQFDAALGELHHALVELEEVRRLTEG